MLVSSATGLSGPWVLPLRETLIRQVGVRKPCLPAFHRKARADGDYLLSNDDPSDPVESARADQRAGAPPSMDFLVAPVQRISMETHSSVDAFVDSLRWAGRWQATLRLGADGS